MQKFWKEKCNLQCLFLYLPARSAGIGKVQALLAVCVKEFRSSTSLLKQMKAICGGSE